MAAEEQPHAVTLIAQFRVTARLMVDELVTRLRADGFTDVTSAHHPVLENIDPDGTRLTTLAARAGMTHQSMSELVAGLERNGYLERRPDPSDGRARIVRLTHKGRILARRAIEEIAEIETAWLERFRRAGLDADMREILASGFREHQHAQTASTSYPAPRA